jgi:hypothetical protein
VVQIESRRTPRAVLAQRFAIDGVVDRFSIAGRQFVVQVVGNRGE